MERIPCEADSHSASQGISHLLLNTEVHYRVHKRPPLVPILRHMHPVNTFPPNFPMIHSNVILPFTPRSSEWSLPIRLSTVFISYLSHASYMLHQSILLNLITLIIFGEAYKL
jgi:hypothetical protein